MSTLTRATQLKQRPLHLFISQMIIMQHKQRHHLIDKYVGLPATTEPQAPRADVSPFLANFYLSN